MDIKSTQVLVTGANGYVASWLVKLLLEKGCIVHAAVRNPNDDNKVGHLKQMSAELPGEVRFYEADLLTEGSYTAAMEGCSVVFHTASPFTTTVSDPQKELIDPAVKGTENILNTANRTASVQRVVVTSSCAAMCTDAIDTQKGPNGMLDESMWNTTSSLSYQPYYLSKTLAEQKAWEIAEKQKQWKLVTINPSFVLGPPLNPAHTTSESMNILTMMGDGTFSFGTPQLGIGMVDVRDVAKAHFKAGFMPNASGRYITSGYNSDFLKVSRILKDAFPKYPLPPRALPKWLLMIVGPLANKLFTRKFIKNNVNEPWKADNSKIVKELGMEFYPMEKTLIDSFNTLIEAGILKKR